MRHDLDDVVSSAEIARRLEVKRNTVCKWQGLDVGFPRRLPAPGLGNWQVWSWEEVRAWAMREGYPRR